LNAKAIHALEGKVEFVKMDKETLIEMRKETKEYLDEKVKKRSDFAKKVLNSQEEFVQEFDAWRKMRSGVNEPIPYEEYIEGKFWYYE
jgi:TRAP-type mannitol/chloroaromatic compound transport system substrate-binding protein